MRTPPGFDASKTYPVIVQVYGGLGAAMVQKAWAAGFGTLIAVSGPTALAVQTARRAGLTLAGFVRGQRLNVYAPERIQP